MDHAEAAQLRVREERIGRDVAAVGSEVEGVPGDGSGRQGEKAEADEGDPRAVHLRAGAGPQAFRRRQEAGRVSLRP